MSANGEVLQELILKVQQLIHENKCLYSGPNDCNWQGSKSEMLMHFEDQHNEYVLKEPYTIAIDTICSSKTHYLMPALNIIYLIQVQVCLESMSVYYSVRFLENEQYFTDYKLRITRGNDQMNHGMVASETQIIYIGEQRIAIGIKTLEDIFKGRKFNFELNINNSVVESNKKPLKRPATSVCASGSSAKEQKMEMLCIKCNRNITEELAYKFDTYKCEWLCSHCVDHLIKCDHCPFSDTSKKLYIHKRFYCNSTAYCIICRCHLLESLSAHYKSVHTDITKKMNSIWTVENGRPQYIIIKKRIGLLFGELKFNNNRFSIKIGSQLQQGMLHKYTCTLELHYWDSRQILRKIMLLNAYEWPWDWYIAISNAELNRFIKDNKFKIKITLSKN